MNFIFDSNFENLSLKLVILYINLQSGYVAHNQHHDILFNSNTFEGNSANQDLWSWMAQMDLLHIQKMQCKPFKYWSLVGNYLKLFEIRTGRRNCISNI